MARKLSPAALATILEHTAATKEGLQEYFEDAIGVFVPRSGNYADIVGRLVETLGQPDAQRAVLHACIAHIQPKLQARLEEYSEEGSAYVLTSDPAIVSDVFNSRGNLTVIGEALYDAWATSSELGSLGTRAGSRASTRSSGGDSGSRSPGPEPVYIPIGADERYSLIRKVGEGSFGWVWEATDRKLGRSVALKMLKPDAAADAAHRFDREIQLLAGLRHQNIVNILDRGDRWFAMELGERSLASVGMPANREHTLHWIWQISGALAHAHSVNVIHRDLKPENIILFSRGAVAKVTDFGLGKELHSSRNGTETFAMMGTPRFSAPEQFVDAKRVDRRADVYSLGQILYVLLTGDDPMPDAMSSALGRLGPVVQRATAYRASERFDDVPSFMLAVRRATT